MTNLATLTARAEAWLEDNAEAPAALVRDLLAYATTVTAQLPESMKHCTILFRECEKGHGWLTATNWVQHECPTCALDAATRQRDDYLEAGRAVVAREFHLKRLLRDAELLLAQRASTTERPSVQVGDVVLWCREPMRHPVTRQIDADFYNGNTESVAGIERNGTMIWSRS